MRFAFLGGTHRGLKLLEALIQNSYIPYMQSFSKKMNMRKTRLSKKCLPCSMSTRFRIF